MASFNKVILLGNLTRDPELRVTAEGQSICKIGVATNRTFKDKEGNQRDETTFVDVDAFGRQAEVISQYFNKGKPILLEGRLRYDQWETANGEKRNKLKVTLESFTFIGNRMDQNLDGDPYAQQSPPPRAQTVTQTTQEPPTTTAQATPNPVQADDDDDVPF